MKKTAFGLLIALVVTAGCKGVPQAYQGEFEDKTNNIHLELAWNKAAISMSGRNIENKLAEFKIEDLQAGKAQVYAREHAANKDLIELFWVLPNMSTKQEGGGMTWYEAEIFVSLADANLQSVTELKLLHCARGMVLIDTVTSQSQIGCPGSADHWSLKKTKDVGNPGNPGGA